MKRAIACCLVSMAGCQPAPSEGDEVFAGQSAQVASVNMRLSIQSSHKVMNGGAGDFGHQKPCCYLPRVPLEQCPWWALTHFDGTTLVPGGVFWFSGARSSVTRSGLIEGPYNCVDSGSNDWQFPPWLDGVPDLVNNEIASIEYWAVNPNVSHPSSVYTFVWKEDDGFVNPDDRFEWRVEVANWINSCNLASSGGVNGTYVVDSNQVNGGHLCDNRGCHRGDYRVAYSVLCTVTGGSDSGGGAGGGGGTGGGGGGGGGGGCGSNNNQCFGSFNACAAACCGVCERRINCGGASAHKCFE